MARHLHYASIKNTDMVLSILDNKVYNIPLPKGGYRRLAQYIRGQKLKLEGFNNLTKSLSFNIYDLCYARSKKSQIEYLEYIDEEYNSKRLEAIVVELTRIINAKLVHVSTQDYEPRGASLVALLNEHSLLNAGEGAFSIGHLDKSHIAIHTYPEYNERSGIASFRVDVDIATCGMISPLSALYYLIQSFESDVVMIDYRVRGFTRDKRGIKVFIDHDISSIQHSIPDEVLRQYNAFDINIISDNNFHTKMRKKDIHLKDFLFGDDSSKLTTAEKKAIKKTLETEIQEIFECKDFSNGLGVIE